MVFMKTLLFIIIHISPGAESILLIGVGYKISHAFYHLSQNRCATQWKRNAVDVMCRSLNI